MQLLNCYSTPGTFFVKALCSTIQQLGSSMELTDICNQSLRMITKMRANIDGKECAMVSQTTGILLRKVKFIATPKCVRSAAKKRLKRVMLDMCIERLIKERLRDNVINSIE